MSDAEEEFSDGEDFSASSEEWNPDVCDDDSDSEAFEEVDSKQNLKKQPAGPGLKSISRKESNNDVKVKAKKIVKRKNSDDSDSDSSVDNYLVDPKALDFKSDFFQTAKETPLPDFHEIEKSIFENVNIPKDENSSDGEINDEKQDHKLNFKSIHDFTKNLESVKASMQNYRSEIKQDENNLNIEELLALGESSKSSKLNNIDSETDDDEETKSLQKPESGVGKDGITITINLPNAKRNMKNEDYRLKVCRRLNLIKKKNQVYIHKVHVLCWIAHGNYVNRILNYPKLMKSALALIPSNNCYPPARTDLKYLEMILKWFIGKMKYLNTSKKKEKKIDNLNAMSKLNLKDHSTLVQILDAQIRAAHAFSKRNLILIFIVLLRALGLQCRLVLSFVPLPLKPNSEDLYSLSKNADEKDKISAKRKSTTDDDAQDTNDRKSLSKRVKKKSVNEKLKSDNKEKKSEAGKENKVNKPKKVYDSSDEEIIEKWKTTRRGNIKEKQEGQKERKDDTKGKPEMTSKKKCKDEKCNPNLVTKLNNKEKKESHKPESSKVTPQKKLSSSKTPNSTKPSPRVTRNAAKRKTKSISPSDLKISQLDGADDEKPRRKLNIQKIKDYPVKKHSEEKLSNSSPEGKNIKSLGNKSPHSSSSKNKTTPKRKSSKDDSDSDYFKPAKKVIRNDVKTPEANDKNAQPKKKCNLWVEVFLEAEEKWVCVDVAACKILCVKELYNAATHPVTYIVAWNNDLSLKDVTRRYVPKWNTVTRKLRAEQEWWDATLKPWLGPKNVRDRQEDEELYRSQLEQPLPQSIQEFKNHPLYALKRHLLKFEAIYPPDAPTLGFIRGEPVYARECVHTLHSRDIWLKEAKVVRLGEKPYKIVKSRPKYDKLSGTRLADVPLEIFGPWQVEDYDPPQAENGIVPRNAYGNVDLFKPSMLPKGTVLLQLPGLIRIARKLQIDCAQAVVGFEFKKGFSVPTYGGFVVCKEFKDTLIAAWDQEEEEAEKKAADKVEKRVYGNWRRLIKALIIREKLKARYNFGNSPDNKDEKGEGSKNEAKKSKRAKK